jgi:glycosyltransferase involved in cell wall biosynthesis
MSLDIEKLNRTEDSESLTPITKRYLLCTNIECYRDEKGNRYIDRLWHKDLLEHFRYLKNFTLASPCKQEKPPKGTIALDSDPSFSDIQFIDLPSPNSFAKAITVLPVTLARLWRAIGQADIVHTGVAGWPVPLGWVVTPIVRLRRKLYIIIVESAFWRLQPGMPATIKSRIRSSLSELLNCWCVNSADFAVFTQEEYRKSLLTKRPERGHIIHASWIDKETIISETCAAQIWHEKLSPSSRELKVIFAGRLSANKGVLILLEAMKLLNKDNIPVKLDILGQGELLSECERVSKSLQGATEIRILGTVPYGPEFFQLLRRYHAIVVPSISDEQPRIVYDAYSQAVPPLATDTAGLRDCIQTGLTGMIADSNDPVALADLLKWGLENLNQLQSMGVASLKAARSMTHQEMHQKRWSLLVKILDKSANPVSVKKSLASNQEV